MSPRSYSRLLDAGAAGAVVLALTALSGCFTKTWVKPTLNAVEMAIMAPVFGSA